MRKRYRQESLSVKKISVSLTFLENQPCPAGHVESLEESGTPSSAYRERRKSGRPIQRRQEFDGPGRRGRRTHSLSFVPADGPRPVLEEPSGRRTASLSWPRLAARGLEVKNFAILRNVRWIHSPELQFYVRVWPK